MATISGVLRHAVRWLRSGGGHLKTVHKMNRGAQLSRDIGLHDAYLSGWFQTETGELVTGVPISHRDIVVDVGCGEGGFLSFCAEQRAQVIGVDLDDEALEIARTRMASSRAASWELHSANAESLPVASDFATRVLCTEVLEHVENPETVLKELYRIGAPGCLYVITVPDSVQEHMQKHVAADIYFQHPNHVRIIAREDVAELVRSAGLEVLSQKGFGFYWSVWWAMFWGCESDFKTAEHPALMHWALAWGELMKTEEGRRIKEGLDRFLPKSQLVIARKAAPEA